MKITIDDKFMRWMLAQVKAYYCEACSECKKCPYYYLNRKHVKGCADCSEIPLLERLMIARKLYEREEDNDLQRKEDRTLQAD